MANSASGESVIRRVVRVMEAFTRERPSLTSAELARATGLSTSTAHRLAAGLAAEGLLARTEDGRFAVGARMWELAARSNPLEEFRRRGLPFLEGVHAAVRQHVALAVPDLESGTVLYIERLDQHGNAEGNLGEVAARLALTGTSTGLAILAHQEPGVRERVIAAAAASPEPSAHDAGPHLRATLAEVRRTGYSRLVGALGEDNVGYAVPVFGAGRAVIGAVSVVMPRDEDRAELVLPVLVAAGRGLSRAMGAERRPYGVGAWMRR
ncbi:IclR family transcriptional regulator [Sinomonas atrocyanea]|uniref:IclR family transcriptional regulator n=1 Tax=Sinomonas atrocyanea TaxID=37927 RepID=UPI002862E038|nr:IclR family transcriptional regulator [Sinomonas atrocyanea]MDR6620427.1 DNA-binding IclR family transcriptional regulator [Sinomonas atrocyanea]